MTHKLAIITRVFMCSMDLLNFYVQSPVSLDPYNFAFLAVTYTAEYAKIYINGNLVATGYSDFHPRNVVRKRNYLAGSCWGNAVTKLVVDDLRIYNRELSQDEITDLYTF